MKKTKRRNSADRLRGKLHWESGTRSAAEGKDFGSVIGRLSDADLTAAYWEFRRRASCYHELKILEAEMERRRLSTNPADLEGQRVMF